MKKKNQTKELSNKTNYTYRYKYIYTYINIYLKDTTTTKIVKRTLGVLQMHKTKKYINGN